MNIYVGNLPREATEEDLRKAFESFGEITTAKIITDRFTGDSRGFGFVEMSNSSEAQAAISGLDGKDLKGRALKVNEARPRRDDRGGGGRGGGGGFGGGGGGGFGGGGGGRY
jgi:RNA recognition motif-containing protein